MSFRLVPKSVTLNDLERRNVVILRYSSEFGQLPGALHKSSRSLSHLLMSSFVHMQGCAELSSQAAVARASLRRLLDLRRIFIYFFNEYLVNLVIFKFCSFLILIQFCPFNLCINWHCRMAVASVRLRLPLSQSVVTAACSDWWQTRCRVLSKSQIPLRCPCRRLATWSQTCSELEFG